MLSSVLVAAGFPTPDFPLQRCLSVSPTPFPLPYQPPFVFLSFSLLSILPFDCSSFSFHRRHAFHYLHHFFSTRFTPAIIAILPLPPLFHLAPMPPACCRHAAIVCRRIASAYAAAGCPQRRRILPPAFSRLPRVPEAAPPPLASLAPPTPLRRRFAPLIFSGCCRPGRSSFCRRFSVSFFPFFSAATPIPAAASALYHCKAIFPACQ